MLTNKFLATLAAVTVIASGALAQPTATLSIHLGGIGNDSGGVGTNVSTLTPLPSSAPQAITLDISDFGSSDFYYVQVTTYLGYANHDPNVALGISVVNSYINLANTGLTIYTGWTRDEARRNNDARKNVNSHIGGSSDSDCADNNNLIDNSAQAWNPSANGGPLAGVPAAVGKSLFRSPFDDTTEPIELYSFVIVVPKQVGVYQVAFDRVLSGGSANTDLRVKTNIIGNTPQGQPYQFALNTLNGTIEVVPEPASMIALGSGLVGLLALRRRRSN